MASIDNMWVEIIRRPAVEWIKGLNGCHDTLICESRSFKYKDGTKKLFIPYDGGCAFFSDVAASIIRPLVLAGDKDRIMKVLKGFQAVCCAKRVDNPFILWTIMSGYQVWGIKRRVRKDGGEKTEEVVGC